MIAVVKSVVYCCWLVMKCIICLEYFAISNVENSGCVLFYCWRNSCFALNCGEPYSGTSAFLTTYEFWVASTTHTKMVVLQCCKPIVYLSKTRWNNVFGEFVLGSTTWNELHQCWDQYKSAQRNKTSISCSTSSKSCLLHEKSHLWFYLSPFLYFWVDGSLWFPAVMQYDFQKELSASARASVHQTWILAFLNIPL